ncbi:RND transporter [Pseudoxanthomonas dokdonensis]|uniref:RND transporter n=2 Tax=Pseudoxanthomonas dokdonensis TaxID=344882 RepID=A0A0R0CFP0_9GAMM|nr:RND transporter [Pseudoxanthomonas dokdonensis]
MLRWNALGVGLLICLAGCGETAPPPEDPPPALVVHPAGGDAALSAYAGEIRAREESALSFRVGGKLVKRHVDSGNRVERGQLLAELDPTDFRLQAQSAQAQLAAAEADLARARDDRDRYAALVKEKLVSQSTYDAQVAAYKAAEGQAKVARAQLSEAGNQTGYAQLRAPAAGVIASRQAEAGQVVGAGQTIYTLAVDGAREVAINLPENRYRQFAVGQPVQVELWNQPGQRLDGRIREISPAADPQTRTYPARVALSGDAALAAVELGQSARVHAMQTGAALSVPLAAIQPAGNGGSAVWRLDPASGQVHLRPIKTGQFGADSVPVLAGLSASDWIVAGGGHLLREGQKVTPVDRSNRPITQASPKPAKAGQ